MSAVLAIGCWMVVAALVLIGLLWDRIESVREVFRESRQPTTVAFPPVAPAPASVARGRLADSFCDPLERLWEAPCAPDPRRLV